VVVLASRAGTFNAVARRVRRSAGWSDSDPRPALAAFQRSCQAFKSRPDSDPMGSYGGTLADWRAPCAAAETTLPSQARAFFERWFEPVAVTAGRLKRVASPVITNPKSKAAAPVKVGFKRRSTANPTISSKSISALSGPASPGNARPDASLPIAWFLMPRGPRLPPRSETCGVLFYTDDPIELFFLHVQGPDGFGR